VSRCAVPLCRCAVVPPGRTECACGCHRSCACGLAAAAVHGSAAEHARRGERGRARHLPSRVLPRHAAVAQAVDDVLSTPARACCTPAGCPRAPCAAPRRAQSRAEHMCSKRACAAGTIHTHAVWPRVVRATRAMRPSAAVRLRRAPLQRASMGASLCVNASTPPPPPARRSRPHPLPCALVLRPGSWRRPAPSHVLHVHHGQRVRRRAVQDLAVDREAAAVAWQTARRQTAVRQRVARSRATQHGIKASEAGTRTRRATHVRHAQGQSQLFSALLKPTVQPRCVQVACAAVRTRQPSESRQHRQPKIDPP
jgi:hypothetical protein